MTPSTFRRGAAGERIAYAITACSLGYVLAATTPRGVCAVELEEDRVAVVHALRRDFPRATLCEEHNESIENLRRAVASIDCTAGVSELDFAIRATAFKRRVWAALQSVSKG